MSDLAEISAAMATLRTVSTATVTTALVGRGIRNVWIRNAIPLRADNVGRTVGPAFTLRFIPAREDLATPAAWASPTSTRAAIEAMPAGAVAVADAGGIADAGIFGDILCQRMAIRGVAGLVTDGAVRDGAGVLATGLPLWSRGTSAPPSVARLTFAGWEMPIGCGGVAVYPGDIVVADGDGAVVVPRALAVEVAAEAAMHEEFEDWVVAEVRTGACLPGLYPPNDETRSRFAAWRDGRS